MRTNFLLEELLLENRLEDVKKKYPEIDSITIEQLASRDPSGNNKYLDWMVKQKKSGSLMPSIIKYVNLFHKNVNKLTKDFFDELIKEKKWEWLLTGSSPIDKTFQKIYKSPKDINNYEDFDLTSQILNAADSKLTKSEVKKLEANILYNSDDLLIMIPKSHRASCYYGSGTKWCTTSKESQTHYNKYTTDGTLIYVINKKEPESNPWYKTAFHIYKVNGNSTAYNAPDVPTEIKVAAEKLGSNWETIRDVIVEYLYKNNLKGIDNFYFGRDLITWLESKNIDPLKSLSPEQLLEKLGVWGEATVDTFISYLKKRNVNMYEYLPYTILFKIVYIKTKNPSLGTVVKNVWDGYKNAGINPLIKMFTTRNDITQVVEGVKTGKISLDDFLHLCSDPNFSNIRGQNGNIFTILKDFYSSGGTGEGSLIAVLLHIFQEDVKLIFGYAKTIGVNLFSILAPIEMNELLNRSFQFEDALKYTLENIDFLKGRRLTYYGFPTKEVLEYISKQPNKLELFERLVSENLLGNLKLNEIYVFIKNKEETLKLWFQENYYGKLPAGDDIIPSIKDFLTTNGPKINEVFPNLESFESAVKKVFNLENFDAFSLTDVESKIRTTTNSRILLKAFFNNNFYEFYKYFLSKTTVDKLDTLFLIKAYNDAPVDEETGLKKLVLERARKEMVGQDYDCKLETKSNVDYVVFSDLTRVLGLFDNYSDYEQILSGNISDLVADFTTIDFSDVIYFLDNDVIVNIIKDYLFNNFRERNITLNLDWLEEFDELGTRVKIDAVKGTFSFVLYDEIIEELSNYKLLSLIENSPQFKKLRDILEKIYKEVFNQEILSDTKNELISKMEDIFGRDFMRPKKAEVKKGPKSILKIEKTVYEFRYDYLMDDIIAFANRYVFYEEELPSSVYALIQTLMDNGDGRFNGPDTMDLEQFIENWHPYQNKEKFTNSFTESLYQTLSKSED